MRDYCHKIQQTQYAGFNDALRNINMLDVDFCVLGVCMGGGVSLLCFHVWT